MRTLFCIAILAVTFQAKAAWLSSRTNTADLARTMAAEHARTNQVAGPSITVTNVLTLSTNWFLGTNDTAVTNFPAIDLSGNGPSQINAFVTNNFRQTNYTGIAADNRVVTVALRIWPQGTIRTNLPTLKQAIASGGFATNSHVLFSHTNAVLYERVFTRNGTNVQQFESVWFF